MYYFLFEKHPYRETNPAQDMNLLIGEPHTNPESLLAAFRREKANVPAGHYREMVAFKGPHIDGNEAERYLPL